MIAKIDIKDCLIDLFYGEKEVFNLNSGNKYYLKFRAYTNTKINLILTMNDMNIYPFSQATLFETKNSINYAKKKVTISNLNFKKVNKELQVSIIYNSTLENINYIYVEIEPKYDINFIHAKVNNIYPNNSNDSNKNKKIITIIVICITILIIISLLIINFCKNGEHIENENFQNILPIIENNY